MSKLQKVVLIAIVFGVVCTTGNNNGAAQTVGDLDPLIITDIYTILIRGVVELVGNCGNANDVPQVQYWLYTRINPDQAIIIDASTPIDSTKPVIILIHGWGGNANVDYIKVIKDSYLSVYDWNIISVDYSVYVAGNYQSAYCYVPAVGKALGEFLCLLSARLGISPSFLHIVGHSLGAQVAGIAGKRANELCGSIGRITGLDPAGPLYQNIDPANRLDKSDAIFVDVIHTNQGQYGYIGDCGHVDFYPNCGYFQPNCLKLTDIALQDIVNLPLTVISCQHQRSCYLFAESIYDNKFSSSNCLGCGLPTCFATFLTSAGVFMGEHCRSQPPNQEYTLTTNGEPPYARG